MKISTTTAIHTHVLYTYWDIHKPQSARWSTVSTISKGTHQICKTEGGGVKLKSYQWVKQIAQSSTELSVGTIRFSHHQRQPQRKGKHTATETQATYTSTQINGSTSRQYILTLHRVKNTIQAGQCSAVPSSCHQHLSLPSVSTHTHLRLRSAKVRHCYQRTSSLSSKWVTQLAWTCFGPTATPLQSRMYCRQPWGGWPTPFLVDSPGISAFWPVP